MLCVSGMLKSFPQHSFFCSNPTPLVPSGTMGSGFTVLYNTFWLAVQCLLSFLHYLSSNIIVRVTKSAHAFRKLNLCHLLNWAPCLDGGWWYNCAYCLTRHWVLEGNGQVSHLTWVCVYCRDGLDIDKKKLSSARTGTLVIRLVP